MVSRNLTVTAIAAIACNGVIGSQGAMPWHIPGDFRRFKQVTMGGVLIMGRTTFESIGKPLPGRTTIVVSRSSGVTSHPSSPPRRASVAASIPTASKDGSGFGDEVKADRVKEAGNTTPVFWVTSVEAALDLAATLDAPIFIAGGAQIYRAAWRYLTRLDITEVDLEPEGDARFPPIDETWVEISREPHDGYSFVIYDRVAPKPSPIHTSQDASPSLRARSEAEVTLRGVQRSRSAQNPSPAVVDTASPFHSEQDVSPSFCAKSQNPFSGSVSPLHPTQDDGDI